MRTGGRYIAEEPNQTFCNGVITTCLVSSYPYISNYDIATKRYVTIITITIIIEYRAISYDLWFQIISPSNSSIKTEDYISWHHEMLSIISTFNRWTHWLSVVVSLININYYNVANHWNSLSNNNKYLNKLMKIFLVGWNRFFGENSWYRNGQLQNVRWIQRSSIRFTIILYPRICKLLYLFNLFKNISGDGNTLVKR